MSRGGERWENVEMGKNAEKNMLIVQNRARTRYVDGAIFFGFLFLALAVYSARGGFARRVVDLTSDAANIATMAAARDWPGNFRMDSQFSNPRNFDQYVAIHVPLTRVTSWLTGDYGVGFTVLLLPTLFLYLVAFYSLGVVLFANRPMALLFTLANMVLVKGPRDTAWGPFKDALPRFDHAVLFAALFAIAWKFRDKRWTWPVVLFIAGIGVYVHPVSTPAMGAMLIGAYLGISIYEKQLLGRLPNLAIGALLFLVAIAPFGLPFTKSAFAVAEKQQLSIAERAEISQIVEERFTGDYLSPTRTVLEYLRRPYIIFGIVPILAAGTVLAVRFGGAESRRLLVWLLGSLAGLCIASAVIPMAIEFSTPPWQGAVFRGELPRAFRYCVPITYMIGFIGFKELWQRVSRTWHSVLLVLAVGILAVGLVSASPRAYRAIQRFTSPNLESRQVLELVDATRACCEPHCAILGVMNDPLVIRYSALRSLVFTLKDAPGTACLAEARRWQANAKRMRRLNELKDTDQKLAESIDWARSLKARYLVVELPETPSDIESAVKDHNTRVVFSNAKFVLLDLCGVTQPVGENE